MGSVQSTSSLKLIMSSNIALRDNAFLRVLSLFFLGMLEKGCCFGLFVKYAWERDL